MRTRMVGRLNAMSTLEIAQALRQALPDEVLESAMRAYESPRLIGYPILQQRPEGLKRMRDRLLAALASSPAETERPQTHALAWADPQPCDRGFTMGCTGAEWACVYCGWDKESHAKAAPPSPEEAAPVDTARLRTQAVNISTHITNLLTPEQLDAMNIGAGTDLDMAVFRIITELCDRWRAAPVGRETLTALVEQWLNRAAEIQREVVHFGSAHLVAREVHRCADALEAALRPRPDERETRENQP